MTEGMQNATSPMQQMTVPAMTKVVVSYQLFWRSVYQSFY